MPAQHLRLLALDGGGVRGLSALMILEQLMETVDALSPPKPCDYFDMIGGTSTGGLIAIMLGRLQMSLTECIEAYLSIMDRVFEKKRHRVSVAGKIQGRFDTHELEKAIKETIVGQGLGEDVLLKDVTAKTCKVFVCATSKQTKGTACLASYRSPKISSDLLNSVKIWEACRATSAASSFFDPICIGRYGKEFIDGTTGANNPVWEMWNQAQSVWGSEPLDDKVACLVSIGTGAPSMKPFQDDVLHINETLIAIATETQQTAERFQHDKAFLDVSGRYYRFNVPGGLADIGLEESKKKKEMAAITRQYVGTHDVLKQMQACATGVKSTPFSRGYQVEFKGVPRLGKFVPRPLEIKPLKDELIPHGESHERKVFVLHGLGGIGKTQLAIAFAREHKDKYTAVVWVNGNSRDSVLQSLSAFGRRANIAGLSHDQPPSIGQTPDLEAEAAAVLRWCSQDRNTTWLMIFDNVDRDVQTVTDDNQAYDITQFLPEADHGFVLITTRLASLGQIGRSKEVTRLEPEQALQVLSDRWGFEPSRSGMTELARRLGYLPLALVQAGTYIRASNTSCPKYLNLYEASWSDLVAETPRLRDYENGSVQTTWTISYQRVRQSNSTAAKFLQLWACIDYQEMWYDLVGSGGAQYEGYEWLQDMVRTEIAFKRVMSALLEYSLIGSPSEEIYSMHPVVHDWCWASLDVERDDIFFLAPQTVAAAVPTQSKAQFWILQRRLMPHADQMIRKIDRVSLANQQRQPASIAGAFHDLGFLYADQGKLAEAEEMYRRTLDGYEKARGPDHTTTQLVASNLARLMEQSKASSHQV